MGKQKTFKQLKKIADQLPAMETTRRVRMTGAELIEKGIMELPDGKKILHSHNYVGPKLAPLNHYENLKKAFQKGGLQAAEFYAVRVVNYAKAKLKEEENKNLNRRRRNPKKNLST